MVRVNPTKSSKHPFAPLRCLSCKKRRVQCDSSQPSCKRCQKDGLDCPGYLNVKNWQPASTVERSQDHVSSKTSARTALVGQPEKQISPPAEIKAEPEHATLYIPSWLSTPDKKSLILLSCVEYYNSRMIPSVTPAHPPFSRQTFAAPPWLDMPSLLQELLIVIVWTAQAVKRGANPSSNRELCHYRGSSLAALTKTISGYKSTESCGLVLGSVLMLMFADLQYPASGTWVYHLEAARRIILTQGGFSQCFKDISVSQGLTINFMMVDVFSTTTSDITSLDATCVKQQLGYIDFISNNESILLSNAHACPQLLMQAVIHTNILRASNIAAEHDIESPIFEFDDIQAIITTFDAAAWARTITRYGRQQPQKPDEHNTVRCISAWETLALCFQTAALLYLHLSCSPDRGPAWQARLMQEKQRLSTHIRSVLQDGSTNLDDPVETQLWRCLAWPLVVCAYVRVGWGWGEETVEFELSRLYAHAKGMAPRSAAYLDGLMNSVLFKRLEDGGKVWAWNDGLTGRVNAI